MNKRMKELIRNLKRDIRNLRFLVQDLEERFDKETFQDALFLFEKGWRLENWSAFLTDTFEEITLKDPSGEEVGYWADGAGRRTDEIFGIIGVENTEKGEEILYYLSQFFQVYLFEKTGNGALTKVRQ